MRIIKTITSISIFVISAYAYAGGNTSITNIDSLALRDSGHHTVFVQAAVPGQGCDLDDRAILVESDGSGQAMLGTLLVAISAEKPVLIQVDGCADTNPGTNILTAPKLIKVKIYSY